MPQLIRWVMSSVTCIIMHIGQVAYHDAGTVSSTAANAFAVQPSNSAVSL